MNASGSHGVAVGQDYNLGLNPSHRPLIRYSFQANGRVWPDADVGDDVTTGSGSQYKELRDACWAGGSVYWAAGQAGLIYTSTDDGETWDQRIPPGFSGWPAFSPFDIRGLAFRDAISGVFVGSIGGVGKAFVYRTSGVPAWIDVSPNAPGLTVKSLSDVDILLGGNIAYAVGVKLVGGLEEGVILTCDISQSSPAPFAEVPSPPTIASCVIGDDLESIPVLKCVALTPNGDVWTGGECGRVWRLDASLGQWTPVRSQTSAHIRGLSFPANSVGFGAALSNDYAAYSIVRYP